MVASGFNPAVNGFSFANWQSESISLDTTISLLVQLFGESSICQSFDDLHNCKPYPKAEEFSHLLAASISSGRCEGMVVLASQLYATGKTASGMSKSEAESSILYWWASQILPSVTAASNNTKQLLPTDLLPLIASGISNNASSTLGLYFRGLGHTVLPFHEVQNGNIVTIDVYDSNTPLLTQHVLINTLKNSWIYEPSDSSGNIIMKWSGTGTGSMDLIPLSVRQPQSTSYFFE
jgi:hypothetical protein